MLASGALLLAMHLAARPERGPRVTSRRLATGFYPRSRPRRVHLRPDQSLRLRTRRRKTRRGEGIFSCERHSVGRQRKRVPSAAARAPRQPQYYTGSPAAVAGSPRSPTSATSCDISRPPSAANSRRSLATPVHPRPNQPIWPRATPSTRTPTKHKMRHP